jgi:ABC-type uncharacterized transport system YnjBCD ATPase subunit
LLGVWRRFLAELPTPVRRSILQFQPFVLMGPAGSGKSALVDAYTDWRRQAKQYLGSSLEDQHLQLYVGSRALVLELPAPVLGPTRRRCPE